MDIEIKSCDFQVIKDKLVEHLKSLSSPIDSFLEEHILESNFYEVILYGMQIGYFSIYKSSTLTQFFIDSSYKRYGQDIFDKVKKYELIESAFVPTCDEFYLSHVLDRFKHVDMQAYFFQDNGLEVPEHKIIDGFHMRKAENADCQLIKEKSGDFFDILEKRIGDNQIYIGMLENKAVSFGIIEKSIIYDNIASIGMFTIDGCRQHGIGRNTIMSLKQICCQQGIIPIAGCWYYNHNSKKTLESAGMFTHTRLLKVGI